MSDLPYSALHQTCPMSDLPYAVLHWTYPMLDLSYIRPTLHHPTLDLPRCLPSSMSSCGIRQILSRKSEFCGIPWNFNGKQLAGASAILVSNSMEILTFFQGIPMEMVRIPEPPGMIPMGITVIYIVKNSYDSKN